MRLWRALIATPGRWPRIAVAIACALIVGMFLANHDMGNDPDSPRGDGRYRPVLARGDGHMLYLMARSTALDGDWDFGNDLARFGDPWNAPITKTGRKSIIHPIGPALVWTPLIWLAEGTAWVADVFGADIQLHGYTLWHQRIVFLSSALFACGAVLLGRRLAKRLVGGTWAPTYAAIAVLLGTSITYYGTYMPSYSHAMDAFACAAFLCYWGETAGRSDVKRWLVLGVLLGIATLVRTQELAMGIVVALEVGVRLPAAKTWRERAWWIGGGAIVLAVTAVLLIPQLVEWDLVFGAPTQLPQGKHYTRMNAPMIAELLWSARNGWFTVTPIAYACVIGLGVLIAKKRGVVAGGLVAAVAIQVFLNSTIQDYWGSAAFGQRRLCNVTLPMVVGLAALLAACGRAKLPAIAKHAIAVVVFGGLVAWNLGTVYHLRGGAPAPSELEPCCKASPTPRFVYDLIGNPFELPASAVFAIRHGVSLQAWDRTVGNYPLMPPLDTLTDERYLNTTAHWTIPDNYLVSGWGAYDGKLKVRWTTGSATALVPNLMPEGQRMTLALRGSGRATVSWNGDVVADVSLTDTPAQVHFDVSNIALGMNELSIDSDAPVGVGQLDLAFIH